MRKDNTAARRADNIARLSEDSEKVIERYLCRMVEKAGGICLKFASQHDVGFPDRIVVLPHRTMWVELKSRGKKPTLMQKLKMAKLASLGSEVHVVDSREGVDKILQEYGV